MIYYPQVGQALAQHVLKSFLCLNYFAFVDLQTALSALPQLLQTAGLCPVQHPLVCDPRDRVALSEIAASVTIQLSMHGVGSPC